jgi:hypothetical protein
LGSGPGKPRGALDEHYQPPGTSERGPRKAALRKRARDASSPSKREPVVSLEHFLRAYAKFRHEPDPASRAGIEVPADQGLYIVSPAQPQFTDAATRNPRFQRVHESG